QGGGKDSKGGLTDERSNGERLLADYPLQGGGKDSKGGLTDERSNGERLLADYPLQGGGKDPEGGLIVNRRCGARAEGKQVCLLPNRQKKNVETRKNGPSLRIAHHFVVSSSEITLPELR
ncbi:MAG: hypothetical protein IJB08_05780, partial [Alistipes sp.]|nr:hypothetical protein [Alistipes sp.]